MSKQTYVRLNDEEQIMLEELRKHLSSHSPVPLKNSDTIRYAIKQLHSDLIRK